jgi:hypothetical protein
MKRVFGSAFCLICCFLVLSPLHAQEIEDFISKYTGVNGEAYMQPMADALTANFNSGLYQTARIPVMGFHLKFDLSTTFAPISEDNKTFTATTESPFTPEQTAEAPTIFGDPDPVTVSGEGGTSFIFPGGFALKRLPFLVPQLTVGSIRGTEVTFRFFQLTLGDSIGKIKLFGFGARHSISQYLEDLLKDVPVDLAASFFFQSFDVGDVISANSSVFGLQASYTMSNEIITLYGGPSVETGSLDITYEFSDGSQIDFDMDSNNSARFMTGVAFNLRIVRFYVDYNFASQSAVAFGLGFGSGF